MNIGIFYFQFTSKFSTCHVSRISETQFMRSHKAGRYTFQTILMQKLNCIVKLIFVDILAISHFKCMVRKCKSLEKTTKRSCFASQAVKSPLPSPPYPPHECRNHPLPYQQTSFSLSSPSYIISGKNHRSRSVLLHN